RYIPTIHPMGLSPHFACPSPRSPPCRVGRVFESHRLLQKHELVARTGGSRRLDPLHKTLELPRSVTITSSSRTRRAPHRPTRRRSRTGRTRFPAHASCRRRSGG